jgi:hypothetical protein
MTGRIGQHPIFADLGFGKVKICTPAATLMRRMGETAGAQEG